MIKVYGSRFVGRIGRSPLFRQRVQEYFRNRINIVYYHAIDNRFPAYLAPLRGIGIDSLSSDLRLLAEYFRFVSLDHLLDRWKSSDSADEPELAITFDDGFSMIKCGAMDALVRAGAPATIFVVTSCLEDREIMWPHKLEIMSSRLGPQVCRRLFRELAIQEGLVVGRLPDRLVDSARVFWPASRARQLANRLWQLGGMPDENEVLRDWSPYMTWEEVDQWTGCGFDVGLHSNTHPFCSGLSSSEIEDEIVHPARSLAARLGKSAIPFAYPFGDRAAREQEERLSQEPTLSCLLGIGGNTTGNTPPCSWSRMPADPGIDDGVFGRQLLNAIRKHRL